MTSPGPMGGGDETAAALNRWVADAEAMAGRYQQLAANVERVAVSETTPDGLITVTVNSAGVLTDLRIVDRATGVPGPKIASGVLWAMRRAQSRIAGQVAELMKGTIGEDAGMVDAVMTRYQNSFPAPTEPVRPQAVEEVRIGDREPVREAPAPQPARAGHVRAPVRRPAAAQDWDGGGNDSLMEEVDR